MYHTKTKHVELDIHFVREKVSIEELSIRFVFNTDQTTDILIKALTYSQFHYFKSKLNVLPESFSLKGDIRIYDDDD